MVDYYTKLKNKDSFEKYLALGKEVYPNENWEDFEIEYIDQNYDLSEKAQLYNEMDGSGLLTAKMYMLFGDVYKKKKNNDAIDSAGIEKYTQKAIDINNTELNRTDLLQHNENTNLSHSGFVQADYTQPFKKSKSKLFKKLLWSAPKSLRFTFKSICRRIVFIFSFLSETS